MRNNNNNNNNDSHTILLLQIALISSMSQAKIHHSHTRSHTVTKWMLHREIKCVKKKLHRMQNARTLLHISQNARVMFAMILDEVICAHNKTHERHHVYTILFWRRERWRWIEKITNKTIIHIENNGSIVVHNGEIWSV